MTDKKEEECASNEQNEEIKVLIHTYVYTILFDMENEGEARCWE